MLPPQALYAAPVPRLTDERAADIVIFGLLAALGLFTIAALPRAVARFSSPDSWTHGWTLRHSPPKIRDPMQRVPTTRRNINADWFPGEKPTTTRSRVSPYSYTSTRITPAHFPSLRTVLYPVSGVFSKRMGGYSAGQLIVLAGYAVLIAVGLLLYCDPVTNAKRAGWIAMSQIPVSVALAGKNSLIGLLVGKGYEKLNYIHRWVGQLMFVGILFHVVSFLVMWTKANTLTTKMTGTVEIWGLVATGGVSLIVLGALPIFRQRFWSIFSYTHWIGLVVLLVGLCYHVDAAIPFALTSLGIYALDLILRLVQSHYVTATIHYIPELKSTRVVVPTLSSGWRAGQHVRLQVVSTAMGFGQAMESHPFTIATTSEDEDGLVLYCREAGDWTRSLATLARGGVSLRRGVESGMGAGQRVNVIIQGPYGGPGNTVFSSYSAAVFICGGGGITFGLGATQEVIRNSFDRSSRLRLVDLVWIVQDPSSILPLLPTFTKLIQQAEAITSVSLRISVHYTRATAASIEDSLNLPEGITLSPGRPDLADMLSSTCSCASALKNTTKEGVHGVVVGVCGPDELLDDVRQVENAVGAKVRAAVGGVELVEEAFAW